MQVFSPVAALLSEASSAEDAVVCLTPLMERLRVSSVIVMSAECLTGHA